MKGISKNLITDRRQIKGGQQYIYVMCLRGHLMHEVITVVGQPFLPKHGSMRKERLWFMHKVFPAQSWGGEFRTRFSLRDCNVIPNHYNQHSLWKCSAETLAWLSEQKKVGAAGIKNYLSVLQSHGRGHHTFTPW